MDEKSRSIQLRKWHYVLIALLTLAVVGFTICLAILLSLSSLIEKNIRSQTFLEPGNPLFEKWTHPKYDMETRVWTFSVKNPDAILNDGKPIVKRLGPYVFDQVHKRHVHAIANQTVSYETTSHFQFNENKSCDECYLYNRVWIPNMIYQKFVEAASNPSMKAATAALLVQTPFLEVEVSELLFDGYADPFLDQVCSLPFVNFVCESVLDLPERIGFFYGKNGSSSGKFVVKDGHEDSNDIGQILSWEGNSELPENWWSSPEALEIRGSDGTLFRPYLQKDKPISVFVKDLCRSVDLHFKEEVDYKGVLAYRYIVDSNAFNNALPENKGFCNNNGKIFYDEQDPKCLPSGLLDISRCQKGEPPVVLSLPHFLHAADYVVNSVEGLDKSNAEEHEIQLDLEPRLGSLFRAVRRIQINVAMWKGKNLSIPGLNLSKFHNTIVPVLMVEDYIEMDQETFDYITEKLILTERLVRTITIAGMCAAGILVILAISLWLYKHGHFKVKYAVTAPKEDATPTKVNGKF
uniref:Lysosome membrane protein 2 n=1 Tax=Panagrellus redivivus TaxID=6233 RepID=A0A7E4VR75_PANRE